MQLDFVECCNVDRLNEVFELGDFFLQKVSSNLEKTHCQQEWNKAKARHFILTLSSSTTQVICSFLIP